MGCIPPIKVASGPSSPSQNTPQAGASSVLQNVTISYGESEAGEGNTASARRGWRLLRSHDQAGKLACYLRLTRTRGELAVSLSPPINPDPDVSEKYEGLGENHYMLHLSNSRNPPTTVLPRTCWCRAIAQVSITPPSPPPTGCGCCPCWPGSCKSQLQTGEEGRHQHRVNLQRRKSSEPPEIRLRPNRFVRAVFRGHKPTMRVGFTGVSYPPLCDLALTSTSSGLMEQVK